MREYPDVAHRYGKLEKALARAHPNDSRAYAAGKAAFVQRIDARAAANAKHAPSE